jgi:hypothetical protein
VWIAVAGRAITLGMARVAVLFRVQSGWLRQFWVALGLLIALAVSAPAGLAGEPCCPMLASAAPCHADALDACGIGCSFCQARTPALRGPEPGLAVADAGLRPLADLARAGTLPQPATPPPRG